MKRSRNSMGNHQQGTDGRQSRRVAGHRSAPLVSQAAGRAAVLITGGAGFIGTNLADHLLSSGQPVVVFDNLSRPGVKRNLAWLRDKHGELLRVEVADVQDYGALRQAVRGVSKVFHFAAQVAVTTSLENPFHDFEVNARGTLNLLEALRELREPPPLVFTSTNKVYGNLNDVRLNVTDSRYEPHEDRIRLRGFNEARPLDFHSPYGCSKGAAEQYVLDYARTFSLPAVVFRMSCIYGPHQFGTEDQGWVAHFLIRALKRNPITVYGDGKQVRDTLFIDDLVEAFVLAPEHIERLSGQAFNIGGSSRHTISLLELIELITELQGSRPMVRFDEWRPADQQYYVSDTQKFAEATGWSPRVTVRDGVERLFNWLRDSRERRVLPFVVPAPALVTAANGKSTASGGKRPQEAPLRLPAQERRSKRIWKLGAAEEEPFNGKIIKFP
jgi:CDP-paratose 2-epimerase